MSQSCAPLPELALAGAESRRLSPAASPLIRTDVRRSVRRVQMMIEPVVLGTAHTKAVTQVKFNREGDILLTSGKDRKVAVWWAHNGQRLGTYECAGNAVWAVDVSYDSRRVLSACYGMASVELWELETGKRLLQYGNGSAGGRGCSFGLVRTAPAPA